jgi:selenide, water dikinase
VLRPFEPMGHPDLLVGLANGDDAAVWRRPDGRALIATVDFFTPVVDDARTWGRIASVNSASDVYAMGGTPLFALNVVAWPKSDLPMSLLGDVLEGAADVARIGGWPVVGGHSIDGAEPLFGQVFIGEVAEGDLLSNVGAKVGDSLVLTKALGTGLISTAVKRLGPEAIETGGSLAHTYTAAVTAMTTLNAAAAAAARAVGARCATDVTGFGLAGHLFKLLRGSGVAAELDFAALPILPGVDDLIAAGMVPGGTGRNLEFVGAALLGATDRQRDLLGDPQTSGGLLVSVPAGQRFDMPGSRVIGRVVAGPAGQISIH